MTMNKSDSDLLRPKERDKSYEELLNVEIAHFFITKDKRIKEDLLEDSDCQGCGASYSDSELYLEKNYFKILRCRSCEMLYVSPRPKKMVMKRFFEESQAIADYALMVEAAKTFRQAKIFIPLAAKVDELLSDRLSHQKILEIGCGPGLLLETLKEVNPSWAVEGVDISPEAVNICQAKGLAVSRLDIESEELQSRYDLIVLWAVLDHFSDPVAVMKKIYDSLNVGGFVLIGNMNVEGLESQVLGPDNHSFAPPERLNYYGIKSIKSLLERCSFSNIDIRATGFMDTEILFEYWNNGGKNMHDSFVRKVVLSSKRARSELQDFIQRHNMAGHMTVCANKQPNLIEVTSNE